MNQSNKHSELPLDAIDTVARFSGLTMAEVLQMICSKMQGNEDAQDLLRNSGMDKHIRAITTVCRYAGIDMQEICTRLAQRKQSNEAVKHDHYRNVA